MNLKKGTITVPPDEPEVVQHICLAFVTATLYLLVQPRPPKIEEVMTSPSLNKIDNKTSAPLPSPSTSAATRRSNRSTRITETACCSTPAGGR